jgi:hypothetical protein
MHMLWLHTEAEIIFKYVVCTAYLCIASLNHIGSILWTRTRKKKVGHEISHSRVPIQAYIPETCNEATTDR